MKATCLQCHLQWEAWHQLTECRKDVLRHKPSLQKVQLPHLSSGEGVSLNVIPTHLGTFLTNQCFFLGKLESPTDHRAYIIQSHTRRTSKCRSGNAQSLEWQPEPYFLFFFYLFWTLCSRTPQQRKLVSRMIKGFSLQSIFYWGKKGSFVFKHEPEY